MLDHEVGGTVTFHDDYSRIAAALAARGVRPPCLIAGVQYIPIAFYAGCASAGNPAPGEHVALLIQARQPPPSYAGNWPCASHHRHLSSQGQRLHPVTGRRCWGAVRTYARPRG